MFLTSPMFAAVARPVMMLCCLGAIGLPLDAQAEAKKKTQAAAATPAKAEAAPKAPAAAPQAPQIPWLVNCASVTGKMACEAEQSLTIKKTGQLLLKVSVRIPEKSKTGAMMLQLPHGMFLPEGVSLTIDEKTPKKEPVQMCDQKGCYVGLALDDALLKEMQSGKTLSIAFKNLQKNDIKIPVSLSGFKEAYNKLL
jgi:invasion protein IalB